MELIPARKLSEPLERMLFPSRHMAKALEEHGSGLRLTLYGLLLQGAGLLLMPLVLWGQNAAVPGNARAVASGIGLLALVAGYFVTIWGKYRCFQFPLKLSGRWLLTVAVWCDATIILVRLLGRGIPAMKSLRAAEPLIALIGLVFFLLFLRSLAGVIERLDLRRSVGKILATIGVTLTAGIVAAVAFAARRRGVTFPAPVLGALIFVAAVGIIAWFGLYSRLLWRMSAALADFARFLRAEEGPLEENLRQAAEEPA